MIQQEKEWYDDLPLHEQFLYDFGVHQWRDWDYCEIDCWYEWKENEDIWIHDVADWIKSKFDSLTK